MRGVFGERGWLIAAIIAAFALRLVFFGVSVALVTTDEATPTRCAFAAASHGR